MERELRDDRKLRAKESSVMMAGRPKLLRERVQSSEGD